MLLHVCSIEKNIISQYPALSSGLGTFSQEYTIKLKLNNCLFALSTPRNISLPLQSKVQAELQHMQGLGVISPVQEPTLVCSFGCGS